MPQQRISSNVVTNIVNTTTASQQIQAASMNLIDNSVFYAEVTVLGKDTTNNPIISKQFVTGSVNLGVIIMTITNLFTPFINAANAGASTTVSTSGVVLSVVVTAPAIAKTVEWQCELKVYIN